MLLVTASYRMVGKEGDNLRLMTAEAEGESLCQGNKEVFESITDKSHLPATFKTEEKVRLGAPAYGDLWWWIMRAMLFHPSKGERWT